MLRTALKMLIGDQIKYAGLIVGISFTAFLVSLAGSFFAGFLTRGFALVSENPRADVWVMDPAVGSVEPTIALPGWALGRIKTVEGVGSADPIAIIGTEARLPGGGFVPVEIVAVDDATLVGAPPMEHPESLRDDRTVYADAGGTTDKLVVPVQGDAEHATRALMAGDEVIVNDRSLRVAGVSAAQPRFPPRPLMFMTLGNALRVLPQERSRTTFVLVRATKGQDGRELAARIERRTGLRARTAEDFKADTVHWNLEHSEDVGDVSTMLVIAGFVGLGGTGVLLFMFTQENLRHYAVLAAMGASRRVLAGMVMAQAGLTGALGGSIGIGLCAGIGREVMGDGAPFRFMWFMPPLAYGVVLAVCLLAALLSVRPIVTLTPA